MADLNDEMRRLAGDAARDQLDAGFQQMAGVLANYYLALLRDGIPAELAGPLVMQLQQRLTTPQ